jgi:hypothetical protein
LGGRLGYRTTGIGTFTTCVASSNEVFVATPGYLEDRHITVNVVRNSQYTFKIQAENLNGGEGCAGEVTLIGYSAQGSTEPRGGESKNEFTLRATSNKLYLAFENGVADKDCMVTVTIIPAS